MFKNYNVFFISIVFVVLFNGICIPKSIRDLNTGSHQNYSYDTTQSLNQFLREYEKTFDPSKYPVPISIQIPVVDSLGQTVVIDSVEADSLEYSTGYRVQVLTTQEVDQANEVKNTLGELLPTEWIYIVYHAPFYKVRVGNFYDRSSANRMVKTLTEKGVRDAWVVPDEIVKNPPVKLPPVRMPVDTMMQH